MIIIGIIIIIIILIANKSMGLAYYSSVSGLL